MSLERLVPPVASGFDSASETAASLWRDVQQFHTERPVEALAVDTAVGLSALLLLTPQGRAIGLKVAQDAKHLARSAVNLGDDLAAKALGKQSEFALETVGALRPQMAARGTRTLDELLHQPMLTDAGGRWRMRHSTSQRSYRSSSSTQLGERMKNDSIGNWVIPVIGATVGAAAASALFSEIFCTKK